MDQIRLPKHVIDRVERRWASKLGDGRRTTGGLEEKLARLRGHRNNIRRYRRLLDTKLSDVEQQFIEQRLKEEQAVMEDLTEETFPVVINVPNASQAGSSSEDLCV